MKKLWFFLGLSIFIYGFKSFACSCAPKAPIAEAVKMADAVFVATVLKVTDDPASYQRQVAVLIDKSYKGLSSKRKHLVINTPSHSAACGFNFKSGESYLIYAYLTADGKNYNTNICSRTSLVKDAAHDIAELEKSFLKDV